MTIMATTPTRNICFCSHIFVCSFAIEKCVFVFRSKYICLDIVLKLYSSTWFFFFFNIIIFSFVFFFVIIVLVTNTERVWMYVCVDKVFQISFLFYASVFVTALQKEMGKNINKKKTLLHFSSV